MVGSVSGGAVEWALVGGWTLRAGRQAGVPLDTVGSGAVPKGHLDLQS